MSKTVGISRRDFLRQGGIAGGALLGGSLLAACGPTPTPEVVEKLVKETVVVEKEVEVEVTKEVPVEVTKEVLVTPIVVSLANEHANHRINEIIHSSLLAAQGRGEIEYRRIGYSDTESLEHSIGELGGVLPDVIIAPRKLHPFLKSLYRKPWCIDPFGFVEDPLSAFFVETPFGGGLYTTPAGELLDFPENKGWERWEEFWDDWMLFGSDEEIERLLYEIQNLEGQGGAAWVAPLLVGAAIAVVTGILVGVAVNYLTENYIKKEDDKTCACTCKCPPPEEEEEDKPAVPPLVIEVKKQEEEGKKTDPYSDLFDLLALLNELFEKIRSRRFLQYLKDGRTPPPEIGDKEAFLEWLEKEQLRDEQLDFFQYIKDGIPVTDQDEETTLVLYFYNWEINRDPGGLTRLEAYPVVVELRDEQPPPIDYPYASLASVGKEILYVGGRFDAEAEVLNLSFPRVETYLGIEP